MMWLTIAKHLIVGELSVFGIQDTKFKIDRALKMKYINEIIYTWL